MTTEQALEEADTALRCSIFGDDSRITTVDKAALKHLVARVRELEGRTCATCKRCEDCLVYDEAEYMTRYAIEVTTFTCGAWEAK